MLKQVGIGNAIRVTTYLSFTGRIAKRNWDEGWLPMYGVSRISTSVSVCVSMCSVVTMQADP